MSHPSRPLPCPGWLYPLPALPGQRGIPRLDSRGGRHPLQVGDRQCHNYSSVEPSESSLFPGWSYPPCSMAMELRDTGSSGFFLPADQILPTGEEVWPFCLLYCSTGTVLCRSGSSVYCTVVQELYCAGMGLPHGRGRADYPGVPSAGLRKINAVHKQGQGNQCQTLVFI